MRVIKEANVRRNEILDVAQELFLDQGYDKTSTTDILERVGIARGTLYYHFSSKEEILEAVISRFVEKNAERARAIARDPEKSATEKLASIYQAPRLCEAHFLSAFTMVYDPEYAGLHQNLLLRLMEHAGPVIAEIVSQGNEEGVFHTPYPLQSVQMLMPFVELVLMCRREWDPGEYESAVRGFIFNAERLLGAEAGSLEPMLLKLLSRKPDSMEKAMQKNNERKEEETDA